MIGKSLKEARDAKFWTQDQAAEALGWSANTYRNYENRGGVPDAQARADLLRVFPLLERRLNEIASDPLARATSAVKVPFRRRQRMRASR